MNGLPSAAPSSPIQTSSNTHSATATRFIPSYKKTKKPNMHGTCIPVGAEVVMKTGGFQAAILCTCSAGSENPNKRQSLVSPPPNPLILSSHFPHSTLPLWFKKKKKKSQGRCSRPGGAVKPFQHCARIGSLLRHGYRKRADLYFFCFSV